MHSEYVASSNKADVAVNASTPLSAKDGGRDTPLGENDNNNKKKKKKKESSDDTYDDEQPVLGHMQERVVHFDQRTRQMDGEWYLKFAELRRGSFLPTRNVGTNDEMPMDTSPWSSSTSSVQVAAASQQQQQQQHWENRPPSSIRFLHWVGFDTRSALQPPSEEITHALAFLCYDFFGRIVEKVKTKKKKRTAP